MGTIVILTYLVKANILIKTKQSLPIGKDCKGLSRVNFKTRNMESIKKELNLIQQIKEMNQEKYNRKTRVNNFNKGKVFKSKLNEQGNKLLPKSKPLY